MEAAEESNIEIQKNLTYIIDKTSNIPRLLVLLFEKDVISLPERENVEKKDTHESTVASLFLDILMKKGPGTTKDILIALRRTGNSHVADKISGQQTLHKTNDSKTQTRSSLEVFVEGAKHRPGSQVNVTTIIVQEGESPEKCEKFENVMDQISLELELLSLKYVYPQSKHLLKAFEFCTSIVTIKLHNVNILGIFSRKIEMKSLKEFEYFDDNDINDIKNMEIDERLQFFKQLLFFAPKHNIDLRILNIKITVSIGRHFYIKISDNVNVDPFTYMSDEQLESIAVVTEAFDDLNLGNPEDAECNSSSAYYINEKSVSKNKFHQIVDTCGEVIANMQLSKVTLTSNDLATYLKNCRALKHVSIDQCELEGDFGMNQRVNLPELETFRLDVKIVNLSGVTKIYNFFETDGLGLIGFYKDIKLWEFKELFDQQVDIFIKINGQIMLDVRSQTLNNVKLSLNNVNQPTVDKIFNEIDSAKIKLNRLYLNQMVFPERFILTANKPMLDRLVLRYVFLPNMSEFLRDCVNLTVLIIFEANNETIFFSRDLSRLRKLKRLSLNNAVVKFPTDELQRWNTLEDLHLYHCTCYNSPYNIHLNFPRLRQFTLDTRSSYNNPLLLKSLFRIESLHYISLWRFQWVVQHGDANFERAETDVKYMFITEFNENEPYKHKNFLLEKDGAWKLTRYSAWNNDEWRSQEGKHFHFQQFFDLQ